MQWQMKVYKQYQERSLIKYFELSIWDQGHATWEKATVRKEINAQWNCFKAIRAAIFKLKIFLRKCLSILK